MADPTEHAELEEGMANLNENTERVDCVVGAKDDPGSVDGVVVGNKIPAPADDVEVHETQLQKVI